MKLSLQISLEFKPKYFASNETKKSLEIANWALDRKFHKKSREKCAS